MRGLPAVSQAQAQGFRITVIDVSKDMADAQERSVRRLPTYIRFENGREVNRRVGTMFSRHLEEFCRGL